MSLEFTDLARFYEDSGMTDAQQHEDFAIVSDVLDYIARVIRQRDKEAAKKLGITFDQDPIEIGFEVESKGVKQHFNDKVADSVTESESP